MISIMGSTSVDEKKNCYLSGRSSFQSIFAVLQFRYSAATAKDSLFQMKFGSLEEFVEPRVSHRSKIKSISIGFLTF